MCDGLKIESGSKGKSGFKLRGPTFWIRRLAPSFIQCLHVALEYWFTYLFVDSVMLFANPHGKVLS